MIRRMTTGPLRAVFQRIGAIGYASALPSTAAELSPWPRTVIVGSRKLIRGPLGCPSLGVLRIKWRGRLRTTRP